MSQDRIELMLPRCIQADQRHLDLLRRAGGKSSNPVSTSPYRNHELTICQQDDLPTNYQQRQCSEFMKLGMQGTSVIIASGDSGVAARSTDDGNADGCLGKGEVFNPDFPASCPYITAAGATFLPPGGNPNMDQEVAVTRFPSGGGFSNIYPRPAYQNTAVNTYLTQHTPTYKTYNTSGMNNPPESVTNGGKSSKSTNLVSESQQLIHLAPHRHLQHQWPRLSRHQRRGRQCRHHP